MTKYNKLWAVLIGLAALVALNHFEIELPGFDQVVMDLIVAAITAFGVYQVPNQYDQ